ncbi:hypothetical protein AB6M97_02225 [Streptococcus hillyeri]|uniref:Uncharacterized protein n=1 Tax=Streptococcus hillyeri TaxID=2282420 RepID=A0A3L9DNB0_9STRE|nr:hypothetical protein [Streptococcus hillyeri]RLY01607.1 hypothetical protein EAF07_09345 [Streptococcus hillyeri]
MSKCKLTAFATLASLALPLFTTNLVNANEITYIYEEAQTPKTSDPCRFEIEDVTTENFVNFALPGDRGSEGLNSEKIANILKSIPLYFTFNFR